MRSQWRPLTGMARRISRTVLRPTVDCHCTYWVLLSGFKRHRRSATTSGMRSALASPHSSTSGATEVDHLFGQLCFRGQPEWKQPESVRGRGEVPRTLAQSNCATASIASQWDVGQPAPVVQQGIAVGFAETNPRIAPEVKGNITFVLLSTFAREELRLIRRETCGS